MLLWLKPVAGQEEVRPKIQESPENVEACGTPPAFLNSQSLMDRLDPYKLFGSGNVPERPYVPQTGKERIRSYLANAFASPTAIGQPFFSAIGGQISNTPPQWDGFSGYMQRTGVRAIFSVSSKTIETPLMAVFGYEQRYYPCYCTGTWHRIGHAMLFQLLTVNRDGRKVLNFPRIFADYAGEMIATTPYPGPYDTWQSLRNGNGYFYWGWWVNILSEFSPDLSRLVHRLQRKTGQSVPTHVNSRPVGHDFSEDYTRDSGQNYVAR